MTPAWIRGTLWDCDTTRSTAIFGQPSAGGLLFTLLHPDSSQTLSFTPRGKRDRTLSVGSLSSWHRHRPPTKLDNDAPSAATKQANTTLQELMECLNHKERHYAQTHKVNRKSNFFFVSLSQRGVCSLSCTIPYKQGFVYSEV